LAAWLAERASLAGIIGAFAMGIAFEESHFRGYSRHREHDAPQLMKPITDLLAPVFSCWWG